MLPKVILVQIFYDCISIHSTKTVCLLSLDLQIKIKSSHPPEGHLLQKNWEFCSIKGE